MNNIRYASIRSLDVSNGENVGVSLFVQGCNFKCKNCFNSETWDFNGGKEWTEEVKKQFLELAARPYIKRISILGGEPLADENLDGILNLVNEIRLSFGDTKTIWIYSGYTWNDVFTTEHMKKDENEFLTWNKRAEIISKCNIFVDGQYIDSQRDITLKWKGSANQRVIDVQKSLQQNKIILHCD